MSARASARSRLHLGCISAASVLHLCCVSAASQPYLDQRTMLWRQVVRATAPLVQALEDGAGQPAATPAHLWQSLRGELAAVNSEILSLQTRVASLQQYFRQAVESATRVWCSRVISVHLGSSRVISAGGGGAALARAVRAHAGDGALRAAPVPDGRVGHELPGHARARASWEYGYEMFWCCELLIAMLVFIFFRASGLLQLN